MMYDTYGRSFTTESELCDLLYQNPDLSLVHFMINEVGQYNHAVDKTYAEFDKLKVYEYLQLPIDKFDEKNQTNWYMPVEYKLLDIAEYILSLCKTDAELQRVGQELLLYHERDLFDLLRYMKYLVDHLKENGVFWGVGRGSSTASYCLYLLGVHRIDSLFYDLDPTEFLR